MNDDLKSFTWDQISVGHTEATGLMKYRKMSPDLGGIKNYN